MEKLSADGAVRDGVSGETWHERGSVSCERRGGMAYVRGGDEPWEQVWLWAAERGAHDSRSQMCMLRSRRVADYSWSLESYDIAFSELARVESGGTV